MLLLLIWGVGLQNLAKPAYIILARCTLPESFGSKIVVRESLGLESKLYLYYVLFWNFLVRVVVLLLAVLFLLLTGENKANS